MTGDLRGAFIHFDHLPGDAPNYFCRVWSPRQPHEDTLEIDEPTGQPWQGYDGTCVVCVSGDKAEIIGILKIPFLIFWQFRRQIHQQLGVKMIGGDSWDAKTKTKRRIEFNLVPLIPQILLEKTGT